MTKYRLLQSAAFMAVIAFFVCGQQAVAQLRQPVHIKVVPGVHSNRINPEVVKEKKALYQESAGFGFLPPIGADGGDSWPCFGGQTDCSTIANGGVVIGEPFYSQSLTDCDASSSTFSNCGQIFNFWEDDTQDTTDDLIISVTVKQGANYILNTGSLDFGANPFGGPDSLIVLFVDTAFGTQGETGPGNGFCAGSAVTCVNPKAGLAIIVVTTTVGTSTIKSTSKIFLE